MTLLIFSSSSGNAYPLHAGGAKHSYNGRDLLAHPYGGPNGVRHKEDTRFSLQFPGEKKY